MLNGKMGFAQGAALAQHNAFHAVIADDTAPYRIVQIQHQSICAPCLRIARTQQAAQHVGISGRALGGEKAAQ